MRESEPSSHEPSDDSTFIPRTRLKTAVRICGHFKDDEFIKIGEETDHGVDVSVDGTETSVRVKKAFPTAATNHDIYNSLVKKAVDHCARGLDFYMVTYGSKGSGKTHYIFGLEQSMGVLRLFVEELQEKYHIDQVSDFVVGFSFFELNQYHVFDCLSDAKGPKFLRTRLHQPPVDTLTEYRIYTLHDLEELLHYGTLRRASFIAEFCESDTTSNVCACITVRRTIKDGEKERNLISRTYFFDLTGTPTKASETAELAKDLVSLHSVVKKVVLRCSPNFHLSTLVRFLEPFLLGKALGCVLGTLHPSDGHQKEAVDTLNFLWQLSKIMTVPEVHYDEDDREDIIFPKSYDPKICGDSWDQSMYACMLDPPEAPCLVEVFSDYSLSYWRPLGAFKATLKLLDKSALMEVSMASKTAPDVDIRPNYGVVEVNADTVERNSIEQAHHLDLIAINGTRFFLLLLNEAWTPLDLSRESVFMRYVRLVSRKAKEELNAQLKQETEADFLMLTNDIKKEVLTMNNEFYELKKSKDDPELDHEELAELADQLSSLRGEIENHTSLHQVVKETIDENLRKNVLNVDDYSDSAEVVRLRALVDNANSGLGHIGCHLISFSRNVFNSSGELCVRVYDHQKKLYANLGLKMFKKLYADFYDMYRRSQTPDLADQFNLQLYALDVPWFLTEETGKSTLLAEHVKNSIPVAATRRASSVAQLQDAFYKRKSVIARLSMGTRAMPDCEGEQFMHHVFSYMDNDVKAIESGEPFEMLLDALVELHNQFSIFRISENTTKESVQKKALIFYSICKFQDQIAAVNHLLRSYYFDTQKLDLCVHLDVAFEQLQSFESIFRTWARIIADTKQNCVPVVKSLHFVLANVERDLGSYAFSVGTYLPNPDNKYAAFKQVFTEGLLNAGDSFIQTLQGHIDREHLSVRVVKRILTAHLLRDLYKYVGNKTNFRKDFYLEVFRPVVSFYETTFGENYKHVASAKFVMIRNRIQKHFSTVVTKDIFDTFEKVIDTLKKQEDVEAAEDESLTGLHTCSTQMSTIEVPLRELNLSDCS